jgi:hypothetical protein
MPLSIKISLAIEDPGDADDHSMDIFITRLAAKALVASIGRALDRQDGSIPVGIVLLPEPN